MLAVIIPVYNERDRLRPAIDAIDAVPPPGGMERRLFIVDDGSTDGTRDITTQLGSRADISVVLHDRNRGKGAAVRSGIQASLAAGASVFLIHDADLEYDPRDHERVLTPIAEGRADAVIGSRFLGSAHRVLYFWHFEANRFITLVSNLFTNLNLSDIECCTKAFTADVAKNLHLREERFGIEPELIARLAQMRLADTRGGVRPLRIYEVAVDYAGRTYAEGKKITWRDGIRALWVIARCGLDR